MASGDVVALLGTITQPGTVYATFDNRAGGSTPSETLALYNFDDASDEHLDQEIRAEGYGGGDLVVSGDLFMLSANSGAVRIGVAIRRLEEGVDDVGSSHAYSYTEATVAVPGTAGMRKRWSITIPAASVDGLANGESGVLRFRRNGDDAADTASGDMQLAPGTMLVKEA